MSTETTEMTIESEPFDTYVPHARCGRTLRRRIDEIAQIAGVPAASFVRGCVEFVLDGAVSTSEFEITRKMSDARSDSEMEEQE